MTEQQAIQKARRMALKTKNRTWYVVREPIESISEYAVANEVDLATFYRGADVVYSTDDDAAGT